ncbi:MAG: amidohydrolase family protein [Phycisphaerales bacterium JB058]
MSSPFAGIRVIDTLMDVPEPDSKGYANLKGLLRGDGAKKEEGEPVSYMFKGDAKSGMDDDSVAFVLAAMDAHNVGQSLIELGKVGSASDTACQKHPDRFLPIVTLDPNRGMGAVRYLEKSVRERGVVAASITPAFLNPQVPIDDKRCYPIYAKCVELDIPVFITVGVPGPRVPMAPQNVELLDEVCWFFPELKIVMRHGAEPWEELAVKLMLKWPNLYYSTSAFAPRWYPKAIIDFANTRGADKIIYAGYFPVGLTLDRIFEEMPHVPFKEHVWPKFLRENAIRVLGLDGDES